MSQPPYLFKAARHTVQADELVVRLPPIYTSRPKGSVSGITFNELVDTGKKKTKALKIYGKSGVITPDGKRKSNEGSQEVPRTAAGVKAVLRRLRPEEAAQLDEIDAQITEAQERLAALRKEREAKVKEAWTRAHVVRLAEVEAMLPKEDK